MTFIARCRNRTPVPRNSSLALTTLIGVGVMVFGIAWWNKKRRRPSGSMAVPHPAGARSLSVWVPDVIGWKMPNNLPFCGSVSFMDTQIMGEEYKCLRCEDTRLLPLDSPKSVQCFECPGCHRQYAHADGRTLTDRWLSPISLPLYRVQFYGHDAPRVAREFIEGFSGKQLAIIGGRHLRRNRESQATRSAHFQPVTQ